MFGRIHQAFGTGAFSFGGLLIIDSITLIDRDLFRFSILLVWVLAICIIQGLDPFYPGY